MTKCYKPGHSFTYDGRVDDKGRSTGACFDCIREAEAEEKKRIERDGESYDEMDHIANIESRFFYRPKF